MRKTIFLLAVLTSIAFAQTDLSNLTDQGCSNVGGEWLCQRSIIIQDASAVFNDDIGCFSTDGGYADLGCLTAITLADAVTVKDCKYTIVDDEIVYKPCEDLTLSKGDVLAVAINPDLVDYSGCSKQSGDNFYLTQCPYAGGKVTFSGILEKDENGTNVVLITVMQASKQAGLGQLLLDNLLYIILIAAIIIIAYWVFAPHKPMFKERPTAKEQPKESIVTRREKRYGRKL